MHFLLSNHKTANNPLWWYLQGITGKRALGENFQWKGIVPNENANLHPPTFLSTIRSTCLSMMHQ